METFEEIEPNHWMVAMSRGGIATSHAGIGNMDKADRLMSELERDIEN